MSAHAPNPSSPDPMAMGEPIHVDRYENAWMRFSGLMLGLFIIVVAISSFAYGIQVPGVAGRIDPNTLTTDESNPFYTPELRELAPGQYEVYMRAQVWAFIPNEIRIPRGSELTFYVTSQDVQHGFTVEDTNINMMVLPGQISKLTARFDEPGVYNMICHEYCGIGHHTMYAQLIVE